MEEWSILETGLYQSPGRVGGEPPGTVYLHSVPADAMPDSLCLCLGDALRLVPAEKEEDTVCLAQRSAGFFRGIPSP